MLSVFVATTNNDEKDSCLRAILICVMAHSDGIKI